MTGTHSLDLFKRSFLEITDYRPIKYTLSLMLDEQQDLYLASIKKIGVSESKLLELVASTFGGWPRAYEFFVNSYKYNTTEEPTLEQAKTIYNDIVEQLAARYSDKQAWLALFGTCTDAIKKILSFSASGEEVLIEFIF